MKTFRQSGETVTVIAPYAVASGGGVKVGATFGVAVTDAALNAPVEIKRKGVFGLPKTTSQAWTAWTTKLYWDDTNKALTTTVGSNLLVGVAAADALAAATSGDALLDGTIR